ncbi:MAG TPA: sugar transferase [Bryobacteraceae bacterium]|jgi:lipopolysaccharide/colanic/teichoic acid biosynthesis glycosyltransferase|nr:sugar transferase [Bryobacteraceae bacterium]
MRRLVDIIAAAMALAVLSPLLAAIMLAVFISSPGSPFYGGWRAGQNGRNFRMWKFRTMIADAAKMGPITGKNDPRVTPLGRILRKTKLDELPQFFNLLSGDMTLVGPRPESPEIVALYTPRQRVVLAVKPGLTGKVQLDSGDESETIPEGVQALDYYLTHLMDRKLQMDLDYLRGRTVFTDFKVVLATAGLVFRAFAGR